MSRFLCLSIAATLLCAATDATAETPGRELTPEQVEFFESKVRPILVDHCYQCHSANAEDLEASLLLDSKQGWQRGGDSGPAIVPGDVEQSLVIQAIRYQEDVVSGMPPKSKLNDDAIGILEQWVSMGAPDPRTEPNSSAAIEAFDLQSRAESHWSWKPIGRPEPPATKNESWPRNEIDRFVLASLEDADLLPASEADKRTWLRRVYLDLIGLPPTVKQIEVFLADDAANAHERVVDQLLESRHYGEKWARHWMDLVRYSETYGHEFDYPIHYAHEYRDYLIRAFNADVPYDQFVREQIAGDLLQPPRRHPEQKFNESVIGTGFWYFHEATHAPTDVLGNESDIINNQLDVFGRSFLGLTIACARCHDHKFDAISTADYYALSAFIQSSCRQHAPLDVGGKIQTLTDQIKDLRGRADLALQNVGQRQLTDEQLDEFTKRAAAKKLVIEKSWDVDHAEVLEDFSDGGLPDGWRTSGEAFSAISNQLLTAEGKPLRPGTVSSRVLGKKQHGVLRSPTFELTHPNIHVLVKSTASMRISVIIDNYQMGPFNALLFKGTFIQGKQTDTNGSWSWKSLSGDLKKYIGHKVYLEFTDNNDGYIEVDQILMSAGGIPNESSTAVIEPAAVDEQWKQEVSGLQQGRLGPFLRWLIDVELVSIEQLSSDTSDLIRQSEELAERLPAPRYVLAMAEGSREHAQIYVRGSHKNLGQEVPPRSLEALGGAEMDRLDLANSVASPENPLTGRVIVNRLWHHLFGRGIVPSVDDFGPQGQPPSHPELLDWLATDLIDHGWSLKHTLKKIVLSQTYRQRSVANPRIPHDTLATVDPTNVLLHKMPVRRLTAEVIRDSILAISGQLNSDQFGRGVPTHLTSFMAGRGRPKKSGPLDGNGRRSIYLSVTRNFLNPFMLTFDMPNPFGPQGRRSRSNVPAQALTLLNDPFVKQQSERWADKVLALPDLNDRQRAAKMMQQAHGVVPDESQADAIAAFLTRQAELYGKLDRRAWADLGHSLFNAKAFYYVR